MSWHHRLAIAACGLALSCKPSASMLPPTGQIVLYVTTDAPLPPAPGTRAAPDDPPALFDTLRIEVFAPGATEPCDGCSYERELDGQLVRDGKASLGVVPKPGSSGYVARARLFRAISMKGDQPSPQSTIDVYAALPMVEAEGILKATVVLHVDDVGRTLGSLSAPTDSVTGEPDFSQIGLWPQAARLPCSGPAPAGEACVPGGAFWMGNPSLSPNYDGSDASDTRLVVVSPFFTDLHEVTVADYRASGLATLKDGSSVDPQIGPDEFTRSSSVAGPLTIDDEQFFCTYSDAPVGREDLPLSCISSAGASAYCEALGAKLPSEAEFEYMASAQRSNLYVWGEEPAQCGDAVWGRYGIGAFDSTDPAPCRPLHDLGGPLPPGSGRLDRLSLEEGDVLDLMGNVSEFTRDTWNLQTEACWVGQPLLTDPECSTPSVVAGERRTVKGSAWSFQINPAALRYSLSPSAQHPEAGFRCVRPGK